MDREAVDLEWREVAHRFRPVVGRLGLAGLGRGAVHEVELRPIHVDLGHDIAVEQRAPLVTRQRRGAAGATLQ
jgi:hypothetical protein